jgi:Fic family protein
MRGGPMSSSSIFEELLASGEHLSLITTKRALSSMVSLGALSGKGTGRYVTYEVSHIGKIFFDVDAKAYCAIEPDLRYGRHNYDFDLIGAIPRTVFTDEELNSFNVFTTRYAQKLTDVSSVIIKRELERFIIELSWKSSRIEGNTYTLFDTEMLLLENKKAPGKTEKETQMIINHKVTFDHIHNNPTYYKDITKKKIEELHSFLVKDMGIGNDLRKNVVGITGSIYRPLDNVYQIEDALSVLVDKISEMSDPYTKALVSLLGLSYIQPFEDGNKRTGRFLANAILLAHGLPPLSYRSVSEEDYREAILVFYELNSLIPFKKIFISQYEFTVDNYTVI